MLGWIVVAALISAIPPVQHDRFRIHFHDVEFTYLAMVGVPFVGGLFVLTTTLSLLVFLFVRNERLHTSLIILLSLTPGAVVFLVLNVLSGRGIFVDHIWNYPLTEVVVLLVGVAWGTVSIKMLHLATAP